MVTGAPPVKPLMGDTVAGNDCPRRHGQLYRYHASGNFVLGTGVLGAMLGVPLGPLGATVGFFAVSVPVFLLTALAHAVADD